MIRILSVDDNTENLYLIEMIVRAHGHEVVSVRNGLEALDQLAAGSFNLIISDILMPAMDGFQLCRTVKSDERWKQIPFIFYTATYTSKQDEELALALGASRFLIKPVEPEEFLVLMETVVCEGESGGIRVPVAVDVRDGETLSLYNQTLVRKLEHKIVQLEVARVELSALKEKYSRAFLCNPAAIAINDLTDASYIEVNETFERFTGYQREEVIGRRWDQLRLWTDPSNRDEALKRLQRDGSLRNWEFGFRKKNGDVGTALLSAELIELEGRQCAITASMDITERVHLENQLRQAQKLESIGRLAGGVAHDFNNLLTVIGGYNGMIINALGPDNPLQQFAEEIGQAAERATSLTQQLLAFSRKQVIKSRPLNVNNVVKDAERMLKRMIGEDIQLVSRFDPLLGQVMADANQIYQVIMNLAVNARDAMPEGGRLIVETANVEVDETAVAEHPEAAPGRHVLIMISDTGTGMTQEVLHKIFEPFFTTKERGKGTGLGLSMVYGIVRQSNGWVEVSSNVGEGTVFKIYLPRTDVSFLDESVAPSAPTKTENNGSETVLVVEDEVGVGKLIETMLRMSGYTVLGATNGAEAMIVAQKHPDDIHVLLTDVVMPGMNGKELFEALRLSRPNLKVLFTSGYTDDVIAPRGVLDRSVAYIPKPFGRDALVAKIREVLSEVAGSESARGQA